MDESLHLENLNRNHPEGLIDRQFKKAKRKERKDLINQTRKDRTKSMVEGGKTFGRKE